MGERERALLVVRMASSYLNRNVFLCISIFYVPVLRNIAMTERQLPGLAPLWIHNSADNIIHIALK